MLLRDRFQTANEKASFGLNLSYEDQIPLKSGEVFMSLVDIKTGENLLNRHIKNVITKDASILAAMLFKDPNSRVRGANMLAVGTGATGAILSPDAPSPDQRKLNAEIARKPWSTTVFRDGSGNAVAIPTNIVDFTATFGEGEAVGPWTEMGIVATLSANPLVLNPNPNTYPVRDTTVDLTNYDILVNYLTFGAITKPATARLTVTWRITF